MYKGGLASAAPLLRMYTHVCSWMESGPRKKKFAMCTQLLFPALSLVVLFLYPSFRAPVNNGFSAHHGRDRWFRVPLAVSYIRLDGFSATQCVRRRVQFAVGPKCNRSWSGCKAWLFWTPFMNSVGCNSLGKGPVKWEIWGRDWDRILAQ